MTLQVEPETYRIETQTSAVGEKIGIPYHSIGISIHPLTPFDQSVTVSYLAPTETDEGENEFIVNELVFDFGDSSDVELPFYATGTTVFSPLDDESTFVYFLS